MQAILAIPVSQISRISSDDTLVNMWLHGRTDTTLESYRRNARYFLGWVGKPLVEVSLGDLQSYSSHLQETCPKESSIRTKLNIIKSLFTFGTKLNYLRFNTAAALRIPKSPESLAGKIIKQSDIFKLINAAPVGRDRSLIKLMYATGMRVSEACGLRWEDFREREDGEVQATILGKGSKIRTVLVPAAVWAEVAGMRSESASDAAVFLGANGGFLHRSCAHRIIKRACVLADLNPKTSLHWLRHSHASHALSRGAKLALVRDSLGHSNIQTTDRYLHANPEDSSSNYLGL